MGVELDLAGTIEDDERVVCEITDVVKEVIDVLDEVLHAVD